MWLSALVWLLGAASTAPTPDTPLFVSAAVSLTEALTECGEAFTAATGVRVRFNFGPSNALARQMVRGAPVDVFVSADAAQMEFAVRAGAIDPASVVPIASNRLVVIVPGDGAPAWESAARLGDRAIRRIAIGDPAAVPAGVYASTWLRAAGLWEAVTPRLVPTATVRGALAAVRTGGVDVGIVYVSDAKHARGVSVVLEVKGPDAPEIAYPAGIARQARRPADARAFLEFLKGSTARRIMERHGFPVGGLASR